MVPVADPRRAALRIQLTGAPASHQATPTPRGGRAGRGRGARPGALRRPTLAAPARRHR